MSIKFSQTEAGAIAQIGRIIKENELECALFVRRGNEWVFIEHPGQDLLGDFTKHVGAKIRGVPHNVEVMK